MNISADQHRAFGNTGLRVPPIMFGTGALGNVRRVIPEQTKLEICGEWFGHVSPPVLVETSIRYGNGLALDMLARAFRVLDIGPEDVLVAAKVGWQDGRHDADGVRTTWNETCQSLGVRHSPRLAVLDGLDEHLAAAQSDADRARRLVDIFDAHRALEELKSRGHVAGVGVASRDWQVVQDIERAARLDWVMLAGCATVLRHPPEVLEFIASLAARQIAVVSAGIFQGSFLVGGDSLDGRRVSAENPEDRSLFAWRKSFVALCHGHGIAPAHACIQFALSAPGVEAVMVDTSRPERVAENVRSVVAKAPDVFWASMKEEGLVAADYPYVG